MGFNQIRDQIEDALSNLEEDGTFEDNSIFDILETLYNNPLNLNRATANELKELRFLNDVQINDIVQHRAENGNFISLYELQSVSSLDMNTIQLLIKFVKIKGGLDDYNVSLGRMLAGGKNEVYVRMDRVLEEQKGFSDRPEGDSTSSRYLGERNRYLFRYRHQYENRLSYGFLLENDAGEPLLNGVNQGFPGFDFYSFHLFLKDYNKYLKAVALGDFAVNMGQGLIMFDGFGSGKGAYVMDIKKLGRPLRPYTSAGEVFNKRGAAINLTFGRQLEFMAFASRKQRDANISAFESEGNFGEEEITNVLEVSSIQLSGLHRTENEIQDKEAIQHSTAGGTVKFKDKNERWHIAANGHIDRLSAPLGRTPQPYNQFQFNGNQLMNASLDYSWVYSNFNFFGETALSDNGGIATLNGLIIGLNRRVSLSLLHRHYQKEYQALFSNSFAETANTNNESGIYLGMEVKPNKHWTISGYFDTWRHEWMRSNVDAPSRGKEYLARITYRQKRRMQAYLQYRDEHKERNARNNETPADFLVNNRRQNIRLNVENNVSKAFTLRNRAEISLFNDGTTPTTYGYMIYQDLIYKPLGFPLSFTTRFAVFDVETSDNRIYAYENSILNDFSIPGYNYQGTRFYVNLRYKGVRNLTLEFRFSQTQYFNQDSFGTGLDEINQPRRSDVRMQAKYNF